MVCENYVFLMGQGNIRTLTTCHSCLWCIKHIYMLVKSALARVFCQTNDHYVSHKFRAHVYLTPIIEVEKGSKKNCHIDAVETSCFTYLCRWQGIS